MIGTLVETGGRSKLDGAERVMAAIGNVGDRAAGGERRRSPGAITNVSFMAAVLPSTDEFIDAGGADGPIHADEASGRTGISINVIGSR